VLFVINLINLRELFQLLLIDVLLNLLFSHVLYMMDIGYEIILLPQENALVSIQDLFGLRVKWIVMRVHFPALIWLPFLKLFESIHID